MLRIAERLARDGTARAPGHRRGHRAGGVADAREHGGHRGRGDAARSSGRSSGWTRTRSPPRPSAHRHAIRSRSSRTRTAASCSRRAIPRRRARLADVEAAEAALPIDEMVERAVSGGGGRGVHVSRTAPCLASELQYDGPGHVLVDAPSSEGAAMMFNSVNEMIDALKPAATVSSDRVSVHHARRRARGCDRPAGGDGRVRRDAGAARHGPLGDPAAWPRRRASARRRSTTSTWPWAAARSAASPCRRSTSARWPTRPAASVFRAAKKLNAGAFIFEIARSEIGYTEQRPHEYAAVVLAAALREGFSGPLFIQGDHVQIEREEVQQPGPRQGARGALQALIKEEIAAGFYNIDIDTSTLVDLDKPTLDEQQEVNCQAGGRLRRRSSGSIEPQGVTVSVGGEIGEVGRQELRRPRAARLHGRLQRASCRRGPRRAQQDQRADRHGARRIRQCRTARSGRT